MNAQQIISTIEGLPTRYTEKTADVAEAKIQQTAEAIAPILQTKGLQISKGGSSPSSTRSYTRIYLEKVGNGSHDYRHAEYQENVICQWSWETRNKYGFHPLTAKAIKTFCDELVAKIEAA